MHLTAVIRALSKSAINCGITTVRHAGFRVWLGDEWNGIRAVAEFQHDELDRAAAEWLIAAAKQHFPNAAFAAPLEPPGNVIFLPGGRKRSGNR